MKNVHLFVSLYYCYISFDVLIISFCFPLAKPQCFSLNDTTKTPNGNEISIENLKVGEKVLAIDDKDQIISTEVVGILHYEKNSPGSY